MSLKAIIFAAIAAGSAVTPQPPFDFRGARIGMTRTEFEKLDPLSGPISCASWQIGPPQIAACSRPGDNPYVPGQSGADYLFGPAPDGQSRLYEISLMLRIPDADAARVALTNRWGAPTSVTTPEQQNGYGASVPTVQATWSRSASTIEFKAPCGARQYFCIYYRDPSLKKQTDEVIASVKARRAAPF